MCQVVSVCRQVRGDVRIVIATLLGLSLSWCPAAEKPEALDWREARISQAVSNRIATSLEQVAGQAQRALRLSVLVRPERADQVLVDLPVKRTLPTGRATLSLRLRLTAGSGAIGVGVVDGRGTSMGWKEISPTKDWTTCQVDVDLVETATPARIRIQPGANILTVELGEVSLVPLVASPSNPAAGTAPVASLVATASSNETNNPPALAVDGKPNTRWCAKGDSPTQWLAVDLGRTMPVAGVLLTWEKNVAGYRYRIEGATNGNDWMVLSDQTTTSPATDVHQLTFPAASIRQLRVSVTALPKWCWASIWEIAVVPAKP